MRKQLNVGWILLFALVVMWILMIQVVPRFLPFDFKRVIIFKISVHTDYLAHVMLFIAIVLVVNFLRIKIKLRFLLPLMLAVAILAEAIQLYIPQRTFNYWDLLSNIAGVIIGVVIVWVSRKAFSPKKE